jgi:hypothetical protein
MSEYAFYFVGAAALGWLAIEQLWEHVLKEKGEVITAQYETAGEAGLAEVKEQANFRCTVCQHAARVRPSQSKHDNIQWCPHCNQQRFVTHDGSKDSLDVLPVFWCKDCKQAWEVQPSESKTGSFQWCVSCRKQQFVRPEDECIRTRN